MLHGRLDCVAILQQATLDRHDSLRMHVTVMLLMCINAALHIGRK